jgi:nucleoid DNA-binding protein
MEDLKMEKNEFLEAVVNEINERGVFEFQGEIYTVSKKEVKNVVKIVLNIIHENVNYEENAYLPGKSFYKAETDENGNIVLVDYDLEKE